MGAIITDISGRFPNSVMSSTYEGRKLLRPDAVATYVTVNFENHVKSFSKCTRVHVQNLFCIRQVKKTVTISFMSLQMNVSLIERLAKKRPLTK